MCLTLFAVVLFFSSCKKEEDDCPKCGPGVTTHYAYVKGYVIDSISGLPVSNAIAYKSNGVFSEGKGYHNVPTDANGMYILEFDWPTGVGHFGTEYLYRPDDSINFYINGFSNDKCGFLAADWGVLIENDTVLLPNVYLSPGGYISTHIKDTLLSSYGIQVNWYRSIGPFTIDYSDYYPIDTIVYHLAFPGIETKIHWGLTDVLRTVNSGDTAFVDVFY